MNNPFHVDIPSIKRTKLSSGADIHWVETTAPPDVKGNTSAEQGNFLKRIIKPRTFSMLGVAFITTFSMLLVRTSYLQLIKGNALHARAERNRTRLIPIPAERGIITDRSGAIIAKNVARFSVMLNPIDLPTSQNDLSNTLTTIATLVGIDTKELEAKIKDSPREPFIVTENIDYDRMLVISIKSTNIPGLSIDATPMRQYPDGPLFAHVVGYTGKLTKEEYDRLKNNKYQLNDSAGKTGVETYYESKLRGTPGVNKIEVNAMGKPLRTIAQDTTRPGEQLTLALDKAIQETARNALQESLRINNARRGSVIAMTPKGEILALVSLPDFDPNVFANQNNTEITALMQNKDQPLYNRAISGAYPPGSTFKLIMATAALAEHIITEHTTVLSVGGISVGKWFFPDWQAGGHGVTNVTKAIAQSVNTFFYTVGGGYDRIQGLGLKKIMKYATLFGLGSKTGIDLPHEATGFLPTEEWKKKTTGEPWYIGDTYHVSIGQGSLLVTPLNIANATVAIANDGTLYQPRVIHTAEDPLILRANFVSPDMIDIVKRGMREAVISGSVRALGTLPVEAAGKTGTAQWHANTRTIAWFTGYAPFKNPEIIVTVMIEEGGEGHTAAVPVGKKIMEQYFKKIEIKNPPTEQTDLKPTTVSNDQSLQP